MGLITWLLQIDSNPSIYNEVNGKIKISGTHRMSMPLQNTENDDFLAHFAYRLRHNITSLK
jgi:hypothetical protein